MRAVWYERQGSAHEVLTIGEMQTPEPAAGEVLVRVHASGVNPSDTKRRGAVRGAPMGFPRIVPHQDGAGVIAAVGAGVPAERVGERAWFYEAQWQRPFGSCAEYATVAAEKAVRLPENVDFAAGTCLGIPAMTAHRCLFADGPLDGLTVLVTGGAGSVGHAAVQLAYAAGATVITTVSSDEKAAAARAAGAQHVLNYRTDDVVARIDEITAGGGVDRVVDVAFGANLGLTLPALKPNGVLATYASDADPEPKVPVWMLIGKNLTLRCTLVYVMDRSAHAMAADDINRALAAGTFKPLIARRYGLEQVADAHVAVEVGQVIGNVVVEMAKG